ncbi:MAG TPA: hypothetical protein VF787_07285 [Thermoanaerobaculia bacterium]
MLLLLRILRRATLGATGSAATATPATTLARGSGFARLLHLRELLRILRRALVALFLLLLLLLLRALLLLLTAAALLLTLLLALLVATLLLATLRLPAAIVASLALVLAAARRFARLLLELAQLLIHEAALLVLMLQARLVVTAIRTALPPLGIGLLAGGAENTFGQWHRRIGAHCTLRVVDNQGDENRRRTLLALVHLAEGDSPSACWDDARAVELLRSQTNPDELRELGADERLITHVFPESHVG